MDPALRREIASRGGRASHGGRGRDYVRGQSLSQQRASLVDRRDGRDDFDDRRSRGEWEARRYNDGRGQRDTDRSYSAWSGDDRRQRDYRPDERRPIRNDFDERGLDFRANRREHDDRDLSDYYSDRGSGEWTAGGHDDDQGGSRSRRGPRDADADRRESGYRPEAHWEDDARGFGREWRGRSDFDNDASEGRGHGRVGRERDASSRPGSRSQRGRSRR